MIEHLQTMGTYFTDHLGHKLFAKSADLMSNIQPIFAAGFSLYVLLLSFTYYKQGLDESIVDITKKAFGWLLVIALAFNLDNYMKVADLLYKLPDDFTSWVSGTPVGSDAMNNAYTQLAKTLATLDALSDGASWYDIDIHLFTMVAKASVWFLGLFLIVIFYFFYLIAKLNLALVLLIGPIFVGAMLFPSTRQYGMNWIGQILNYSVTILLYSMIFVLQVNFIEVQFIKWGEYEYRNIAAALEIIGHAFIMAILFFLVILNIPSVASALTGGASAHGAGATLMRTLSSTAHLARLAKPKGK